ncbi:HNH endonuclease signature motif containing protein [Streptomyces sp. NPDC052687]|uniref:HNH endonuclease signature motif containing protein n=1 Tax=Streptomyces sp. NPDC052687 TaxID=3154759 RepID=UPI003421DC76
MPENRPAVPRELERRLLVEAGHRCAIPACRSTPVELAHIVPWAKVQEHTFDNMIALCPTCHTRYDNGHIDRRAMFQYKTNLRLLVPQPVDGLKSLQRARLFVLYRAFQGKCRSWEGAIGSIALADVNEDPDEVRQSEVAECLRSAEETRDALVQLSNVCDPETARKAHAVFRWEKAWADDVVDGLWPSTHPGADQHDRYELDLLEEDLHAEICRELAVDPEEIPLREPEGAAIEPLRGLGGTGKRF